MRGQQQHRNTIVALKEAAYQLEESQAYRDAARIYRRLVDDHPWRPDGYVGAARIEAKQGNWRRAASLWAACLQRFPQDDKSRVWRRNHAIALERSGELQDAASVWGGLARDDEQDARGFLGYARCMLGLTGPTPAVDSLFADVVRRFPANRAALKGYAQIAVEAKEPQRGLERWKRCIETYPDDIEAYVGLVRCASECGSRSAAQQAMDQTPKELATTDAYLARVTVEYCRLFHDIDRGNSLVRELDFGALELESALSVGRFLAQTHQYPTALELLESNFERFFPSKEFIVRYLLSFYHCASPEEFHERKTRLVGQLPTDAAVAILNRLPASCLTPRELKHCIDYAMNLKSTSQMEKILRRCLFYQDFDTLAYLKPRVQTSDNPLKEMSVALLTAKLESFRMLRMGNLGRTTWDDINRISHNLSRDVSLKLRRQQQESSPKSRPTDLIDVLRLVDELGSRGARLNSAECYSDAAAVAAWLVKRIRARKPTSMIRLGDGEGMFLPYPEHYSACQSSDQHEVQRVWWSGAPLGEQEIHCLMEELSTAIRNANAVGVPTMARCLAHIDGPVIPESKNARGILSVLHYMARGQGSVSNQSLLVSCHVHSDLENWDLYQPIFAEVSKVSVISCHNLERYLALHYGIAIEAWYQTPHENRFRNMFPRNGEDDDVAFYPDIFRSIEAKIRPTPGDVYLVAAGFLGKLLCERIRERGGIALDIGSIADYWMGFPTRIHPRMGITFDIASSLIEGQPFVDHFDGRGISSNTPCRSDVRRRSNLTGKFDRLFESDVKENEYPVLDFLILGHPRCGSRYVTEVFRRLGWAVGHENLGPNGICSWILATDDLTPPFEGSYVSERCYRATLAYVRNPIHAIPSIMLENAGIAGGHGTQSFAFRRFHIFRHLGIDIAARQDPVERAVESYLCWMKMVNMRKPMLYMRVEHLIDDMARYSGMLASIGLELDESKLDFARLVPQDVNSSIEMHGWNKPQIELPRMREISNELRNGLNDFSDKHGYPALF